MSSPSIAFIVLEVLINVAMIVEVAIQVLALGHVRVSVRNDVLLHGMVIGNGCVVAAVFR